MSVVLGTPTPQRLYIPGAGAAFPKTLDRSKSYTSPDGAIVVPSGWGDGWYAYRNSRGTTQRKAFVVFGDSTTFGSGGPYSWLQRIRDRAVGFGMDDGGKGLFAALEDQIVYDSPEINGLISSNFTGSTDSFDTLVGSFYFDSGTVAGHQTVTQFRETAVRIWSILRSAAGSFTYSISVAGSVVASGTINAHAALSPTPHFDYVSSLPTGTKTLTITTVGDGEVHVGIDPINPTGLQVQKQAMSGSEFKGFFYGALTPTSPYTQAIDGFRYQAPLGLNQAALSGAANYRGATVATFPPAGSAISPILAATHLGFNDLTNTVSGDTQSWNEYVKRFAGGCYDAGVDGIVISGQLPYNANWPTYGAARFNALKTEAAAQGLAFVDLLYPVSGPSLSYAGGTTNPHLTKVQYQAQADYLWDNLLGLTV